MSTPGELNITLYYNASHGLVIQFKDSDGNDFDISSYTDFLMRLYPVSSRSQIGSDIDLTRTGSQLDHTFSVEDIQSYPTNMRHEILFKNGADVDPVLRGNLTVTDVLKDDTVSTSAEVTLSDDVNVVTVSDVTIVNELGSISSQTSKTTPDNTDVFVGQESDNSLFKVTWANIKATLKTYFDTLYQSILSEGAFVDGDKTKLDGIESGAEVNDVDSVAGKTGAVSLDLNDLSDTTITNGAENDLLTLESGVWVNKTREEVGSKASLFQKSVVGGIFGISDYLGWDSFIRDNLGNADSGQTWQFLVGSDWQIDNNKLYTSGNNDGDIVYIDFANELNAGVSVLSSMGGRAGSVNSNAIIFAKDANNHLRVHVFRNGVSVIETIAGVESTLYTHLWTLPSGVTGLQSVQQNVEVLFYHRTFVFDESFIYVKHNDLQQSKGFDVSTTNSTFSTKNDISKIGFYANGASVDYIKKYAVRTL